MTENRPALLQGMFTAESKGNTTAQIGYGTKKWGAALGYRYGQCGAGFGTAYMAVKQSCGKWHVAPRTLRRAERLLEA